MYSKNIILGADNDETNFKTLLTLINIFGSMPKKAAKKGNKDNNNNESNKDNQNKSQVKVMVPIYTSEYLAAFNAVNSNIQDTEDLDVVLTVLLINKRDILQKIVAQSILDIYTVPIYKDLFSYQGAELYLMDGAKFLKEYPNAVKKLEGEPVSKDGNKQEVSLECSSKGDETGIIPIGLHLNGQNMFKKTYKQKNLDAGKVIYLSTGDNIEKDEEQPQGIQFNYSDIDRVYLIGNPDMCAKIAEEVAYNNTGKNAKKLEIKCSQALPEKADTKKSLIFYISGGEEGEDIKMVKMYLQDAQRYGFNNSIDSDKSAAITAILIDSESMFRISEKVLEKTPCVISNQIVKRMLAQASISTELLSIYEYLLGSSPNTKEIITTPAEDYKGKTFKELYEKLKTLEEPYFLMGYVEGGRTVLCPNVDEKLEDIERLIILGERDSMDFDENKGFILKQ